MVTQSKGNGFVLYNGVKLPNIDSVWDKESYPYAVIFTQDDSTNACYLAVSDVIPFFEDPDIYWGNSLARLFLLDLEMSEDNWVEDGDADGFYPITLVWSNVDVYNDDDTELILSASDPIPLDGMEVIEWDGDTTGLVTNTTTGGTALRFYKMTDDALSVDAAKNSVSVSDGLVTQIVGGNIDYMGTTVEGVVVDDGCVAVLALWGGYSVMCVNAPGVGGAEGYPETGLYFNTHTTLFAYTAASAPTFDTTSFLSGLTMGLTGKGVPGFDATDTFGKGYLLGAELRNNRPTAEPVAWLYNGVRLPELPEWDRETYPYAYIGSPNIGLPIMRCILYFSTLPFFVTIREYTGTLETSWAIPFVAASSASKEWVLDSDIFDTSYSSMCAPPIWANYNIYYTDDYATDETLAGTLAVAASDPVPVYE